MTECLCGIWNRYPGKGYYYPLYLHEVDLGLLAPHLYRNTGSNLLYANSVKPRSASKPDLPLYTAHLERLRFQINQPLSLESLVDPPYQGLFLIPLTSR